MCEQVFTSLSPGFTADDAALDRAAAELGCALPASYRAFCRACGIGLAGGDVRIGGPAPVAASVRPTPAGGYTPRGRAAVSMLDDGAEPHRFDVEGGDAGVIERAFFFGAGADGGFLFWDVSGTGEEYDIWLLAPDLETIRFAGESLTDFFQRVTSPSAALVLGPGAEPLPRRFEGFSEAILARSTQADS